MNETNGGFYQSEFSAIKFAELCGEYNGNDALEMIKEQCSPKFSVDLPKKGISKKAAGNIVKEITSELLKKFKTGKDIFNNDLEIAKKAALLMENARQTVEKRNYPLTMDECKELYGLHFTEKHTGKMSGNYSLSTACTANKRCIHRMNQKNKRLICFYCFAETQLKNYGDSMLKPFLYNIWLLNRFVIDIDILPAINAFMFRIESFGDIMSEVQEYNYLSLMYKNPRVTFAQWTKNISILATSFEQIEKPENMIVIYSNPVIDCLVKFEQLNKKWLFVDKVFNVVSEKYAKEHGIKFNCGANHCLTCQLCYVLNSTKVIIEKLRDSKSTKI